MTQNNPAVLEIENLQAYYDKSHVLQGINLTMPQETLSLVGKNGMGKTTLCEVILGLKEAQSGSIRFKGREISGLNPTQIVKAGIAYVPQGRRIWPSLTVEEHLKVACRKKGEKIERSYELFPRLFERRKNYGNQLSGGEQQLLAISRALLTGAELLVMDEPTEGLAPVMVNQLESVLDTLVNDEKLTVFLVEQNLGFALSVSRQMSVMVNGQITAPEDTEDFLKDRARIETTLGIGLKIKENIDDGDE